MLETKIDRLWSPSSEEVPGVRGSASQKRATGRKRSGVASFQLIEQEGNFSHAGRFDVRGKSDAGEVGEEVFPDAIVSQHIGQLIVVVRVAFRQCSIGFCRRDAEVKRNVVRAVTDGQTETLGGVAEVRQLDLAFGRGMLDVAFRQSGPDGSAGDRGEREVVGGVDSCGVGCQFLLVDRSLYGGDVLTAVVSFDSQAVLVGIHVDKEDVGGHGTFAVEQVLHGGIAEVDSFIHGGDNLDGHARRADLLLHSGSVGVVHDEVQVGDIAEVRFALCADGCDPLSFEHFSVLVLCRVHILQGVVVRWRNVGCTCVGDVGLVKAEIGVAVLHVELHIVFGQYDTAGVDAEAQLEGISLDDGSSCLVEHHDAGRYGLLQCRDVVFPVVVGACCQHPAERQQAESCLVKFHELCLCFLV